MTPSPTALLIRLGVPNSWWTKAAQDAIVLGHYVPIMSRDGRDLYMVRFWISSPERGADGQWESGNSVLLHWFIRPDDDLALHDHPWDFITEILSGGYMEASPQLGWKPEEGGPDIGGRYDWRQVGDLVSHRATDLHMVAKINPNTWTRVETASRVRQWGFHPPGRAWVKWDEFLTGQKATEGEA